MPTILLTGGRAPATLELARMFKRHGHRVVVAESVGTQLCRASAAVDKNYRLPEPRWKPDAFVDALGEIIAHEKVDLLLPTCEEIFYVARGRDTLAQQCTVFTEPLSRLRILHSKWEFVEQAATCGLRVPQTRLIVDKAHLADITPPYVLKPVFSRFASNVIIVRDARRIDVRPTPQQPWVAQQFVSGRQLCTYSVVRAGRVLAHTAYPAMFTAGQGAAVHFKHIEHVAAFEWVKTFVASVNFTGQIAFDFIETGSGELFALECNPRATSGVHLLASNPAFANVFWEDGPEVIIPDPDGESMLALAMLIYGLPAAISGRTVSRWAAAFSSSRDVAFSITDPLPAFWQPVSLAAFVLKGLRLGISPLEASTHDIEWNGEM